MEQPEGSVGDVKSDAKGSGARFNNGKIPLELIPLRLIAEQLQRAAGGVQTAEMAALLALGRFQEGGGAAELYAAINAVGANWAECAQVFDYGRGKYAEWNWAKGMAWNIPLACAARHLVYGMLVGEELDAESKLPHRGHFICNVVMLLTFLHTYPEGDDRPVKWLAPLRGHEEHVAREADAMHITLSDADMLVLAKFLQENT